MQVQNYEPNSRVINVTNTVPPKGSVSEEERDCILAQTLMTQGKAARSKVDNDWKTRYDFYRGRQWPGELNSIYKIRPTMNIIRSQIQAQLPILTDAKPGFDIMAREVSDYKFAKALSELISKYWEDYQMDTMLVGVLTDEMVLDAGILKCSWDPDLEQGVGNIRIDLLSPWDIFVPFGAIDFDKNCSWVIHRSYKPISELKRMFPEYKDKIRPDTKNYSNDNDKTNRSTEVYLVSPTDQWKPKGANDAFATGDNDDLRKVAEVWELWMDSEELEAIDAEDGKKIQKKKYPNGKLITLLPNQKIRLQCVHSPYKHGYKPFVKFLDTVVPREFWGEGESKVLMPTQRMINKSLSNLFQYYTMMSNPIWINEEDSGITPDQITNQIAAVLTCRPGKGQAIRRDFAPAMPPGLTALYELLMSQAESATGLTEVSQGRKPPGVSAAAAIETLQDAAQTRLRLKERNMQNSLQQMGTQMVGLMLQFYNEPRVIRIIGDEGDWPKFREFFIDQTESGGYVYNQKESIYNEEQDDYVTEPGYTSTPESKGLVDVRVVAGTSMPWAKSSRANIAFRLLEAGAIDEEELLKALEWPNASEVLERKKAAAAEAPPEGPPIPPPLP